MGKTNKGDKTKTTQGKGGSSKQGSKKTGGGIPVDKMRFVPGENQAENYQRLIEHPSNKVLGISGMGSKIAHILREEEEFEFEKPKLKFPDASKKEDAPEEHEQERRELEMEFKEALDYLRKKKETYEEGKEKLTSLLIDKCSSQVLIQLEAQDGWKKIRHGDPMKWHDW